MSTERPRIMDVKESTVAPGASELRFRGAWLSRAGFKTRHELEEENQAWRETVGMLIKLLPRRTRSKVCAQLATIPAIWHQLPAREQKRVLKHTTQNDIESA